MTSISYYYNTEYMTKWNYSLTWYDVAIHIACRPGLWLTLTCSTSPLKPLNRIKQNLTGSNIPTSSTRFMYFRPIGTLRWPPWPLIGWEFFTRPVRDVDILQYYGKIRHPSSQGSCCNVKVKWNTAPVQSGMLFYCSIMVNTTPVQSGLLIKCTIMAQ